MEKTFQIVKKIDWGFCVVEVGKLVITMTTKKDSTKEESIATQGGMAKRAKSGGGVNLLTRMVRPQKNVGKATILRFKAKSQVKL